MVEKKRKKTRKPKNKKLPFDIEAAVFMKAYIISYKLQADGEYWINVKTSGHKDIKKWLKSFGIEED